MSGLEIGLSLGYLRQVSGLYLFAQGPIHPFFSKSSLILLAIGREETCGRQVDQVLSSSLETGNIYVIRAEVNITLSPKMLV
jgi:hypothetical protein